MTKLQPAIVLDQQVELIEGEGPEFPYEEDQWVIIALENTIRWQIGDLLTKEDVEAAINEGIKVHIQ